MLSRWPAKYVASAVAAAAASDITFMLLLMPGAWVMSAALMRKATELSR